MITYEKALSKAMAYCAKGEKSEQEVKDKLTQWETQPTHIEPILHHLRTEHYIDNTRYAHAYTSDKLRFNQWGRHKIAAMLHTKGIARDQITQAIDNIDQEQYYTTLTQLLTAKNRTIKEPDQYKRRNTLFAYAARRGFEPTLINQALNDLLTQ